MSVALALVAAFAVATFAGAGLYVTTSYLGAFLLRPRARAQARIYRAALVELIAAWMVLPFWPLWWFLGGVYRAEVEGVGVARGRRHPIIMLHGFGMNRTQWIWLALRLRARGHGPIYGMNYFSLQRAERSAKKLQRYVEHVLARERCEVVDIVAHSLGGVVARYYIERLSGGRKVGRLVTIGTPHAGTWAARSGFLIPSAKDLLHGSQLLSDLGPVREGAEYTSIWSRADAIVQPPESASIAPAGTDEVFDDLGHLSLILSPRVLDVVDARLRR